MPENVLYPLVVKRFAFTRKQTASNKTPRQINRNLIFNLIRMRQPYVDTQPVSASPIRKGIRLNSDTLMT